jgi:hypothetical protein
MFSSQHGRTAPAPELQLVKAPSLEWLEVPVTPFGSDSAFATAARVATYFRRGPASDRHSSITLSNVIGLKGLRRQRVAPSLSAILRKSGLVPSEKA